MSAPPRTELPKPADPETLYILDLSGYVFATYHALPPLSTSKGEPTNAVTGTANIVAKILREQRPAYLAVAMDGRGGSASRRSVYADYKSNRVAPPPDLHSQMDRIREIVDAHHLRVYREEAFEADDVIATLVARAREAKLRVVIVAADKDLLQLVGADVIMWDTLRDKVYGVPETEAKFGVAPARVGDLLALMGDASDNIPGVPGIGVKTAAALLTAHGDLDGVYRSLGQVSKKSVREALVTHEERARVSRRLVELHSDVPVAFSLDELRVGEPDEATLRALYTTLEMKALLSKLPPPPPPQLDTTLVRTESELVELSARIRGAGAVAIAVVLHAREVAALAFAVDPDAADVVLVGEERGGWSRDRVVAALDAVCRDEAVRKASADSKLDEVSLASIGLSLRGVVFDAMLASYLLDAERHSHSLVDIARADLGVELPPLPFSTPARGQASLLVPDVGEAFEARVREHAGSCAIAVARAERLLRPRLEADALASLYRDVELPLARVLAEMEALGMRLDVPYLERIATTVEADLRELESRCTELAGRPFHVGSPRQLEAILFDELGLPSTKRTKTARSTDHEVLEDLALLHPLPQAILEHRTLSKLKSTYLDALPRQVDPITGRVHTRFNQAVAATGRLSSSDPNLQNIPIRTELGRSLREAFVASEGGTLLAADYSQIELRVLAHLSRDPELVGAFARDVDVHVRTATALFGVDEANVTRDMRGQAKTVNFAVIYGQTQFALARNLRIERGEAKRYIEAFFERYAGVKAFLDGVVDEARRTGEVHTLLGRRRRIVDIHSKNPNLRSGAERIAKNTPIQGSAADIVKVAMVRIHEALVRRGLGARMVLTVHDELVFDVPEREIDTVSALVRETMERAVPLDVPLVVGIGTGRTWGQAH